ncbi:glycosyl hydrolase family 30, partial [Bacteroides xylanisolvens]
MMNLKTMTAIFAIAWAGSTTVSAQKISVYSTTSTERWVEKKQALDKTPLEKADICIYPDSLLQNVVGFGGGTFNELGWDALQCLSPAERDKVMADLFSEDGIRFALG